MIGIARRFEIDAGHRIPNHESKCRNFHGHRYVIEATFAGNVITEQGSSQEGMVQDFSFLKESMSNVLMPFDHAMILFDGDSFLPMMLETKTKVISINSIPTAENLAQLFLDMLNEYLPSSVRCVALRLWETPNCSAIATFIESK